MFVLVKEMCSWHCEFSHQFKTVVSSLKKRFYFPWFFHINRQLYRHVVNHTFQALERDFLAFLFRRRLRKIEFLHNSRFLRNEPHPLQHGVYVSPAVNLRFTRCMRTIRYSKLNSLLENYPYAASLFNCR